MIFCLCDLNLRKDISGKKFGRLRVLEPVGRTKTYAVVYRCLCDCGSECFAIYRNITSGAKRSCGCLHKENTSKANSTHGKSKTRTYQIWESMKKRCLLQTSNDFERYGARGISVCSRWMKFENFLADMGEAPDGLQIDRIDNDKGYYQKNCRWVTPSQNCQNTRRNVFLCFRGERLCLADWSRKTGIPARTLSYRVSKGLTPDEVLRA